MQTTTNRYSLLEILSSWIDYTGTFYFEILCRDLKIRNKYLFYLLEYLIIYF